MEDPELRRRSGLALSGPLVEFLGVEPVDEADPASGISLIPAGNALTALGTPQAGVISAVLEIAAYLALLPHLADEEDAVTHQFSVSFIARAEGDAALVAAGEVMGRSRRLAFVNTRLRQGDRLLASAQVTKSIVGGR